MTLVGLGVCQGDNTPEGTSLLNWRGKGQETTGRESPSILQYELLTPGAFVLWC